MFLDGGATSMTYNSTLTPAASGTAGHWITIDVGANSPSPSGHSGTVIIDGGGVRSSGIYIDTRSYIRVNGLSGSTSRLTVQNHLGSADPNGSVHVTHSSYVSVDYITINNARTRGVFFNDVDHSRIRGCDIRTGLVNNPMQTDGLYLQYGNDNVVENNVVVLGNNDANNHIDALQVANQEARLTVRGNWLEWAYGRGNANSQGAMISGITDWLRLYNNVILGSSQQQWQAVLLWGTYNATGTYYVWNNTIIAQHPLGTAVQYGSISNSEIGAIQNNIIYSPGGYTLQVPIAVSPASKIDYNCLYRASGTGGIAYMSGARTWTQYQALGYDLHGIDANPDYDASNGYRLNATSPCIDRGMNLGADFNDDRDGNARPRGAAWDIGPYER